MRRYVLFYLRFGTAFFAIMASAFFLLSNLVPLIPARVPLWLIASGAFVSMLVPVAVMGTFLVVWERRFKTFAHDLEVLPPTFTQLRLVQSAVPRAKRTSLLVRAAAGFIVAITSIVLLVWQERRFDRLETALVSVGAVLGLGYYLWCRSVMRAEQASRHAEPAAPGDGKGGRA
jgi:hypothetical protein